MRIAILGAGRVGTALGTRWSEGGHDVTYGVRDPHDPRHLGRRSVEAVRDAATGAAVTVLAVPWPAVEQLATSVDVGDAVVVDATNPLAAGARERRGQAGLSGAELIARWVDSDRVVKAFNTTGAANMVSTAYPGGTPLMPVAGDQEDAKRVVMELAAELGFDPVDAGPLAAAVDLEHLAMIWIRLAYQLGNGPDIAFAMLRR